MFWGIILFVWGFLGGVLGFCVWFLLFFKKACISKELRTPRYSFQERRKLFPEALITQLLKHRQDAVLLMFARSVTSTFPLRLVVYVKCFSCSLPPISLPDQLKSMALLFTNEGLVQSNALPT